jgi:CheY-like chemotaxis protein
MRHTMRGDMTVLVAEDEESFRALYRDWLEPGCDLRLASDGDEAVAEFEPAVDVVVLDRQLPGPSGDAVAEHVKSTQRDCPVVMVTAIDPEPGIESMPIDTYLTKPVSGDDVRDALERVTAPSTYTEEMERAYRLAAKKARLEAELSGELLLLNDQYVELCRRLTEVSSRLNRALTASGNDWAEKFRACTGDGSRDQAA